MVCLVVGDANADVCASLECFPLEGDDAAVTSLGYSSGGTAANVAVTYARLGGVSRLLTRVGKDSAASLALHAAESSGVETTFVQYDTGRSTGLCLAAISPSGERTFFSYRGANIALELPDVDLVFQDVHHVHFSGHAFLDGSQRTTAQALLDAAFHRKIPTSIDLCLPLLRRYPRDILTLAPHLSLVFANARELGLLGSSLGFTGTETTCLESAIDELLNAGIPLVVAKLGAAGARVARGLSRRNILPFPITAVDTTGAGDAFVAAFLVASHLGSEPHVAAQIGNAAGAFVASHVGATEAPLCREELCAMLAAHNATEALDLLTK